MFWVYRSSDGVMFRKKTSLSSRALTVSIIAYPHGIAASQLLLRRMRYQEVSLVTAFSCE